VTFVVVYDLVEKGLADAVEVDSFADGRPTQVEVADWLLECGAAFVLTCTFHCECCFKPSR